jgi:hypothetical protein
VNDVEELLRRDRAAGGLPELPDPWYTAAVVRRRQGRPAAPAPADNESGGWLLALGGLAGTAAMVLAALAFGLSPWWLLAAPVLAVPLWPIILHKGA